MLIAAGANEFIVCNIEFMSILMNSLIIESTSILNGITEIIIKRCLGGVYAQIITGNFQYKFYDFENMSFYRFHKTFSYQLLYYNITHIEFFSLLNLINICVILP